MSKSVTRAAGLALALALASAASPPGALAAPGANGACQVLAQVLQEAPLDDDPGDIDFREGSGDIPHPLCVAIWNKPDHETLEAAASRYMMKQAMAKAMKQEFSEPEPPPPRFEVSLTLVQPDFGSAEAAVASLEQAVQELSEGFTVTVQGQQHTSQVVFDDWIDGIGDRAIWAPKLRELQVAAGGRRFAVSVRGFATEDENLDAAVALARRVIDRE